MPNKLTDAEVKKALEHCADVNSICEDCVLFNPKDDDCKCSRVLKRNALDLINRLQAENERLRSENIALNRRAIPSSGCILKVGNALLFAEKEEDYNTAINAIKAEAYKEAFEKVKEELKNIAKIDWQGGYYYLVGEAFFDNLLNELVGDENRL